MNFLQHFTPNFIEHAYSHLVEDLYVHKTKDSDTNGVKRKRVRPPKPNPDIVGSKSATAASTHTIRPHQTNKTPNNETISRDLIAKINVEWEKSDRLTVEKLDTINTEHKQDYKSNLLSEKYSFCL